MPQANTTHAYTPWLRKILDELLDLVAPPRCAGCGAFCRQAFCDACQDQIELIEGPYCPRCGHPHPPTLHRWPDCPDCKADTNPELDGARSVGLHVGPLRRAVIQFKFGGLRHLAQPLGLMMARRFDNEYARPHSLPIDDIDAVVPAVLHPARRKWRGFDQATLLAEQLCEACEKPLWEDVLLRVKHTEPQVDLDAQQREENMKGAFEARKPWKLKGASVLLIDDVYTTGITLNEAARALRAGGARAIFGMTLTRAAPDWHPGTLSVTDA